MIENLIIIPYRNRKSHIEYYLEHTLPLLRQHLPSFHVVIVEQNEGKLFNRGALINIGAIEYKDKAQYLITQDIDTNPTSFVIREYYNKLLPENTVQGIYTSCSDTMGGICKFHFNEFIRINGFPNHYWGWGCEDKALQNRAECFGLTKHIFLLNNNPSKSKYFTILSDSHDRTKHSTFHTRTNYEYHRFKTLPINEKQRVIQSSGVNNCSYTITKRIERTDLPNVTWLQVDI